MAPLLGLGLIFSILIALELHQIAKGHIGAFGTYYVAADALRYGRNPYSRIGVYPYVYPPLYAFLCQPLARLPRAPAAEIMLMMTAH